MSERSDQTRTVTVNILIEDSTTEGADEYVANLVGAEVEARVPSEGGTYVGEIVSVKQEKSQAEIDAENFAHYDDPKNREPASDATAHRRAVEKG